MYRWDLRLFGRRFSPDFHDRQANLPVLIRDWRGAFYHELLLDRLIAVLDITLRLEKNAQNQETTLRCQMFKENQELKNARGQGWQKSADKKAKMSF